MSVPRKVPTVGFPYGVFEDPRNPLIVIENGITEYFKDHESKKQAIERVKQHSEDFTVLFPWGGKMSTDVFIITADDLDKIS